jgi:hypothetical protein
VKHAVLLEGRAEEVVIVENQPQPTEYHDIRISLEADTGKKLIVRLAGDRENGDLLTFDEAVEKVDHRHLGLDHLLRHHPHHRVHRWTTRFNSGIR